MSSQPQAVDKVRQRRSCGARRLNVQRRVRFASSFSAALLDGLSEQPARTSEGAHDRTGSFTCSFLRTFVHTLLESVVTSFLLCQFLDGIRGSPDSFFVRIDFISRST